MPPATRSLAALAVALLPASLAASELGTACDRAARLAADESRVPLPLLRAIARVESGRVSEGGVVAWPWAANIDGAAHYFASRDRALVALTEALQSGAQPVDVGCFQINHRWHGDRFVSLQSMLDPATNARYAAHFLETLHAEFGTWDGAVGAYHSRDPDRARAYRVRVLAALGALPAAPWALAVPGARQAAPAPDAVPRGSAPPGVQPAASGPAQPLVTGEAGRLGSLVPAASAGRAPIAGPRP